MKKRGKYFAVGLFIFLSLILGLFIINGALSPSIRSHDAGGVEVKINNADRTLQDAISDAGGNLIINDKNFPRVSVSPTIIPNPGVSSDNVMVKVGSFEGSFTTAIGTLGLCGASGSYSGTLSGGQHKADEIEVSVGGMSKSLQAAINNKELLYTKNNLVSNRCAYSPDGSRDVYSDTYDSCARLTSTVQALPDCGVSDYSGEYYCSKKSSEFSNDVYRNYATKGCSGDACTSGTSPKKILNCGNDITNRGTCSLGDCYRGWTYPSGIIAILCGHPETVVFGDTCDGDNLNPYTCGANVNSTCIDIDFDRCSCLKFGCSTPESVYFYQNRTVNCFSASSPGVSYLDPPTFVPLG